MRYLFERIVSPCQPDSIELLKEDVRAQVQRLIDSHRIAQHRGAVDILNLAVPSITEVGSCSLTDQESYAADIHRVLRRFEPRLSRVDVSVIPSGAESRAPQLLIQAQLKMGDYVEEFRFVSEVGGA